MSSGSRVRGPNSALTEFLRSQGINASALGRARPPRQSEESAGQSTGTESEVIQTPTSVEENNEDENSMSTTTIEIPVVKRRNLRNQKKKKKTDEEAEDNEDTFSMNSRAGFSYKAREHTGKLDFCAHCNCRFTITPYSKYSNSEKGWLCYPCSRGAEDRSVPELRTRKRKALTRKKVAAATMDEEISVPKLQDLCIRVIAEYINDIEAFGDIGQVNMDKISQIISKNRSLNDTTVKLFLSGGQTELKLYDCSKITADSLFQIAQYCPNLQTLHLTYCGQMQDQVLHFYADHLTELTDVSFQGAFLVSSSEWINFFKKRGSKLMSLELTDTARIHVSVINAIVDCCPNLISLSLSRIFYLDDECVRLLAGCRNLVSLKIESPGGIINDGSILDVLNQIGSGLHTLSLSGCTKLTDEVLKQGIGPCCGRLKHLNLSGLELLTDDEASIVFGEWKIQSGLETLSLRRCLSLGDKTVRAVLVNSGHTLRTLDLNGMSFVTDEALQYIVNFPLPMLKALDVSWIRGMNDKLVCEFESKKPTLEKLLVWGDNHVLMPSNRLLLIGREVQ
ncbi:DNA repair protein rhp7 [Schizosaccharomyces pombe]